MMKKLNSLLCEYFGFQIMCSRLKSRHSHRKWPMHLPGKYAVEKQRVKLYPEESGQTKTKRERERPEALHATVTSNWARTGSSVILKLLNTLLKKQAVDPRQVFSYTRVQEGENVTILSFLGLINLLDVTSCDGVFYPFHPCYEDTLSL